MLKDALRKVGLKPSHDPVDGWLYVQVQFDYPTPKKPPSGSLAQDKIHLQWAPDEAAEEAALSRASKDVERALKHASAEFGYEWCHAYSWPNGALYMYVRARCSEGVDPKELREEIRKNIDMNARSISVAPLEDGTYDPGWLVRVEKVFPEDPRNDSTGRPPLSRTWDSAS